MPEFAWTQKHVEAAQLLAEGRLGPQAIADKVGVTRQTIHNWRHEPAFAARVDEIVEEFRRAVRKTGIAVVERRVYALNDRWQRMLQIIDERAAHPVYKGVAGGSTGLLTHTVKTVGGGEAAQVVDEYALDTGLLRELREHEKQAAIELGQWQEKAEVTTVEKPPRILIPDHDARPEPDEEG